MYYTEFATLINKILNGEIEQDILLKQLIDKFDCIKIYDCDDILVSDSYFTIKHYATGEEKISSDELQYLLLCLQGKHSYDISEKMSMMKTPPNRQA